MRILVYILCTTIVILAVFFSYIAGYQAAKEEYKCDEVGGTSSSYAGKTTAIKLCAVDPQ